MSLRLPKKALVGTAVLWGASLVAVALTSCSHTLPMGNCTSAPAVGAFVPTDASPEERRIAELSERKSSLRRCALDKLTQLIAQNPYYEQMDEVLARMIAAYEDELAYIGHYGPPGQYSDAARLRAHADLSRTIQMYRLRYSNKQHSQWVEAVAARAGVDTSAPDPSVATAPTGATSPGDLVPSPRNTTQPLSSEAAGSTSETEEQVAEVSLARTRIRESSNLSTTGVPLSASALPTSWTPRALDTALGTSQPDVSTLAFAKTVLTTYTTCGIPELRMVLSNYDPGPAAIPPISAKVLELTATQPKGCTPELLHAFRAVNHLATDIYSQSKEFERWCAKGWEDPEPFGQPQMTIGWFLNASEGDCWFVPEAGEWLVNRFGDVMPPTWREFFREFGRQYSSQLSDDGIITIPWEEVRRRLVFWEKFRETHPGFELDDEARWEEERYALILADHEPWMPHDRREYRQSVRKFLKENKASRHWARIAAEVKKWK